MKMSMTKLAASADSSRLKAAGVGNENTGVIQRCVMSGSIGGELPLHLVLRHAGKLSL